jgi:WD40 repeat protein
MCLPLVPLIHLPQATYPDHKYLTAFTREALEFATTFMFTIEAHPLLVYMTALPFAQDIPTLYSHFHDSSVYPKVVGQTGPLDFRIPEVFAGHHDLVWSMAYSPDKTRLASGSMDSTIRIWDTSTGLEIFSVLEGHENTVLSVVFSPDGTMIASCSADKTIRVWDAASGSELFSPLRGHQQAVVSLSFSANCTRIVSGSYDKTVRIWDMKISDHVCTPLTLVGHEGCVTSVSFSPDDTKIVSCSHDRTIRLWNAISGSQVFLQSPLRVDDMSTSVAFSANGRRIISMSQTNATSWDATSGCRLLTSTQTDFLPLHSVAVVAGSQYTPYWIEDLETGRTISNLPFRVRASCSLSYENTLAVGTTDGSVFFMQFPPALWTCAETRAADQRRSDVQVPFTCGVIDQLFPYPYTGGKHHTYRHHIMETM